MRPRAVFDRHWPAFDCLELPPAEMNDYSHTAVVSSGLTVQFDVTLDQVAQLSLESSRPATVSYPWGETWVIEDPMDQKSDGRSET